jgi:hypothetical protein|nr:hypothetical protein [Lelliottia sp. WAP21]
MRPSEFWCWHRCQDAQLVHGKAKLSLAITTGELVVVDPEDAGLTAKQVKADAGLTNRSCISRGSSHDQRKRAVCWPGSNPRTSDARCHQSGSALEEKVMDRTTEKIVMVSALEKEISEAMCDQTNDAHRTPDSVCIILSAHNVYYVK